MVNVGSVGYPRSGICRSYYCVYDTELQAVYFRSLPFDLEGYREKMGGKGLDEAPWMAARAAQRAVPHVRRQAHFGKAVTPISPPDTPKRKLLVWLLILIVLGLVGCGMFFLRKQPKASHQQQIVRVEVAPTPTVPDPAWPSVLTNRTLNLAGAQKVYLAIKLASKSNPVKAHLIFRDQNGKALPGTEVAYPPFASSLSRTTSKNAVPVPQGAATVQLEAAKANGQGYCEITRFDLDVVELKNRKRK